MDLCQRLFVLFLFSLACATGYSAPRTAKPTAVGLYLQTQEIGLRYPTAVHETQLDSITLNWKEQLTPMLQGGISIGSLDGTQGTNPVPAARVLTGAYIAIQLQTAFIKTKPFDLAMLVEYHYADLEGKQDAQKARIRWHQGSLGLAMRLAIADSLDLSATVSAYSIDGKETLSGSPLTQVTSFKAQDNIGQRVGLFYHLDHTGRIGIELESGYAGGGRLIFERWF